MHYFVAENVSGSCVHFPECYKNDAMIYIRPATMVMLTGKQMSSL